MNEDFRKLATCRNLKAHPKRIELRLIENVVNLVGEGEFLFGEEKTALNTSLEVFQHYKTINDQTFAIENF